MPGCLDRLMPPADVARFLLPSSSRSELRLVSGPGAADMDVIITLLVDVALSNAETNISFGNLNLKMFTGLNQQLLIGWSHSLKAQTYLNTHLKLPNTTIDQISVEDKFLPNILLSCICHPPLFKQK